MPLKYGRDIHLWKLGAFVNDYASGDVFQPDSLRDRILPSMGLEVTNDNVLARALELLGFFQHAVRLTDACRVAKKYFQQAPAVLPVILLSVSINVGR